jgi:hypothetical protein
MGQSGWDTLHTRLDRCTLTRLHRGRGGGEVVMVAMSGIEWVWWRGDTPRGCDLSSNARDASSNVCWSASSNEKLAFWGRAKSRNVFNAGWRSLTTSNVCSGVA